MRTNFLKNKFEQKMKNRKKMNKKGFLLGEFSVKIIIAILAILILIMLGAKLFGMFSKENDAKLAGDNLYLIKEKIAYLQSSEYTGDFLYVVIFPPGENWNLITYGQGDFPEKQCVGDFETCLCMCSALECGGLIACEGFKEEIMIEDIPVQGKHNYIHLPNENGGDCRVWYVSKHEVWGSNGARFCIDLSGLNYEDGLDKIKQNYEKIETNDQGNRPIETIQFEASSVELKISQAKNEVGQDIIKIKPSDKNV